MCRISSGTSCMSDLVMTLLPTNTPFDAMDLSKEKSIFILSIMDILEGKLFGIQGNCKMKHLKGDRKWLKPEEFSEHCVE